MISTETRSAGPARRPSAEAATIDRSYTMKAVVRYRYGSAEVLVLEEIARPAVKDGEVLVRVHAAGVDRGVWHVMAGRPYLIRIAGFGVRAPKNRAVGMDLAGVVEAVGKDVTRFQRGDEVFGIGTGSFGEYALAREEKLAAKPTNLTFEQAAVTGISGSTALQAVRDHGRVKAGQEVLIIGASGGVGTFAVQIASSFGARVTGVCSTTKVDLVRSIGADDVIDYTREDFAKRAQRFDLILDIGGNATLARLRRALTPDGTLVIVGGEGGGKWFGGIDRQLRAMMLSPFLGQALRTFICRENHEDLVVLKELIEAGKLTPVVDRTYPLADVPDAIRYMQAGHARGKVAVSV